MEVSESRPNGSRMFPLLVGGGICVLFGLLDNFVLHWANFGSWDGPALWTTYAVFVLQAFVLSSYAGHWLQKSKSMLWAWVFFFLWSLLFTNLVLFILILNHANWENVMQSALAYAFFAAQMGLVFIWGILTDFDWRKRLPLFGLAVVICCFPLWSLGRYQRGWNAIFICYSIAVFASACTLRFSGFHISAIRFGPNQSNQSSDSKQKQFAIRNVLIWTLIVAIAVGVGRLVPWSFLWDSLWAEQIRTTIFAGLLMSVVTVASVWSALNDGVPIWARIIFLVLVLGGVAYGLYQVDISSFTSNRGGQWGYSLLLGHTTMTGSDYSKLLSIWVSWCLLNGLFQYGLLQVFGFAKARLVRGYEIQN